MCIRDRNVFDVNIDGAVGLIISLVVIKAGVEVLRDAVSPLIGDREDEGLVSRIEAYVLSLIHISRTGSRRAGCRWCS